MKIKILSEAADETIRLDKTPAADATLPVQGQGMQKTPDDDATWEAEPEAIGSVQRTPIGYLRELGFEDLEPIGAGAVGTVMSAEYLGRELAIKIVPKGKITTDLGGGRQLKWSGEKEVEAYEAVATARKESEAIERHFPLVYVIIKDIDPDHYFIVMERLTTEGPYAAVIDELFQGKEGLVPAEGGLVDYGAWKDLSRRMFMYFKNKKSRDAIIDDLLSSHSQIPVPDDFRERMKVWGNDWWKLRGGDEEARWHGSEGNERLLGWLEKNATMDSTTEKIFTGGEFGGLSRTFENAPWMASFVLLLMKKLWEENNHAYYTNYRHIARRFVDIMRRGSPIGLIHRPDYTKREKGGADEEVGNVYEEAESIRQALDDLESITGMVGHDMHDGNVMMRPLDGHIVVVDVGLFRKRTKQNENKKHSPKAYAVCSDKRHDEEKYVSCKDGVDGIEEAMSNLELDKSIMTMQTQLNPKIWFKKQVFKEIRQNLLEIVGDFVDETAIEDFIDDITITGSIAGFNWHSGSDIDVHIIVDFKKLGPEGEFVQEIMDFERREWNEDHQIVIQGHEVELYVQDKREEHYSDGVYSLKLNKWVKKPTKKHPYIDYSTSLKKARAFARQIEGAQIHYDNGDYEQAKEATDKIRQKISKLRKTGLEKEGIHSPENIAFKLLRNGGFLNTLRELNLDSYDKMMTLNDDKELDIRIVTQMIEKKKKRKKKPRKPRGKSRKRRNYGAWWPYGGSALVGWGSDVGGSGGDGGGGE